MRTARTLQSALYGAFLLVAVCPVANAQTAPPDATAAQVATRFECNVAVDVYADLSPVAVTSVALYEDSDPATHLICATVNDDVETLSFVLPYSQGTPSPVIKGISYAGVGCTGVESMPSPNACLVTYVIAPPVFVSSSPPSP